MITRIATGASAFLKRVFPERQIYHRAEGQVQYFTLSTQVQVLAATASAVVMGWTAYATASVVLRGHLLSAQSAEAARIKNKYERWLAEARAREASALALLQTRTTDFEEEKSEVQARHDTLKRLLDHATGGDIGGSTPGPRLANVEDDAEAILVSAAASDPTPRASRLAYEAASRDAEAPGFGQFNALLREQEAMLDDAEEAAQDRVENLRAVLRLTDLNVEEILSEGDRARGGPFVSLSEEDAFAAAFDLEDQFARRVARVAARVAEAERLERAIDSAPLGMPVAADRGQIRQTSDYGPRVDPINGRRAMHYGLDLGAFRLAPITAAAPGRVSFVGWKGGYGNVVEIDHGHGFKTRYGHLQRAFVKRGDEVGFGEKVGAMGSTGRSTGVHLHYEVWFKGKHYDPKQFLRAGEYVQQG